MAEERNSGTDGMRRDSGVPGRKLQGRDLPRERWKKLADTRNKMPWRERGAFVRSIVKQTGLSPATVHRRLGGRIPGPRVERAPVYRGMTSEQLRLCAEKFRRSRGAITGLILWRDVLGQPDKPTLRTVNRWLAAQRREEFRKRQLRLPLGPERPTSIATEHKQQRQEETMDALVRAVARW